jgi:hypothetical protein
MAKIKRVFENLVYFEELSLESSFALKPMFGCLAIYFRGYNVAVLAANPGERIYRNKKFQFDLWDGLLIPTSREHHASLKKNFSELIEHPILGKWLYLPQQSEGFEEVIMRIVNLIRRNDPRIGILPGTKKK